LILINEERNIKVFEISNGGKMNKTRANFLKNFGICMISIGAFIIWSAFFHVLKLMGAHIYFFGVSLGLVILLIGIVLLDKYKNYF